MMRKVSIFKNSPKSEYFWNHYSKRKADQNLSVEEILKKYKGFEGDLIKMFQYSLDKSEWQIILASDPSALHLVLFAGKDVVDQAEQQNLKFLGHEYGICEEEGALYSSIFNVVIFGGVKELRKFYKILNNNLLFPDLQTSERYAETHRKLFDAGEDVEWPMSMQIYQVWSKHLCS